MSISKKTRGYCFLSNRYKKYGTATIIFRSDKTGETLSLCFDDYHITVPFEPIHAQIQKMKVKEVKAAAGYARGTHVLPHGFQILEKGFVYFKITDLDKGILSLEFKRKEKICVEYKEIEELVELARKTENQLLQKP